MDNLRNQKSNLGALVEALRYKHSWVMSFLYIGTFGSFIGFSFAFGQVLQINFLAGGDTAAQASLHAAQIAFVGPLLGSISRPFGGKLADRVGGGKITLYTFVAMMFAAGILVVTGMIDDAMSGAPTGGQMLAYVVGFILLFILSGLGNGSTYKMIPSIFEAKAQGRDDLSREEKAAWSRTHVRCADRVRGCGRRTGRRVHQRRAARLLRQRRQVGHQCVLGVPRVLRGVRVRHLVRVPSPADASARTPASTSGAPRWRCPPADQMAHATRTACSYCGVGCGISVETRADPDSGAPVIARVSGDKLHPTNFGRLCTKGATHAELMARHRGPA